MTSPNRRRRQKAENCDCLKPAIRFFGLLTSFVVLGVGVDVHVHGFKSGTPILIGGVMVLIFEIKWVVNLFLQLIFTSSDCEFSTAVWCWELLKLAGGWRLAPGYIVFGTSLILWPHNLWLSYIAGLQMIFLALLRICTILKFRSSPKEEGLLPISDFDKVDVFSDIVEDGFAELSQSIEDENPSDDNC